MYIVMFNIYAEGYVVLADADTANVVGFPNREAALAWFEDGYKNSSVGGLCIFLIEFDPRIVEIAGMEDIIKMAGATEGDLKEYTGETSRFAGYTMPHAEEYFKRGEQPPI